MTGVRRMQREFKPCQELLIHDFTIPNSKKIGDDIYHNTTLIRQPQFRCHVIQALPSG